MDFQKFTPALTHMILNPIKSKNTELLKFALYDLVFIDILILEQEWKFPHARSRSESLYLYISRGNKFNQYTKKYIKIFLLNHSRLRIKGYS
ncbi:hypothetical protein NH26_03255 [Flammeovirga pacifica]|uniref:Uncharacterized protein n=1 Tax=Flammeovirga pacifica TaxID=915059 RepID=A0A1S1YX12_FLAPC|nr:hypothetical protein NH26_03255 [Flammeovirga pacifica]